MKRSILAGVLCFALSARAELSLKEIRTASNNVLVACFKSDIIKVDEVNTVDLSQWTLNGQPVAALNRFVTEADACDHHIYMQVPTLVNGTRYTLETPHGNSTFVFDDRRIFCESIKTNQNAYSALGKVRYANFTIWLGDGGSRKIEGDLPAYTVFKVFTGEQVTQGTLKEIGQDESSGDFVYRIDLSAVPAGGPYKIAVKGYGCSYPFGVSGDFSRRLAYMSFRALYHQRCGCPIVEPYAWNIKMKPCHTTVYDVNGPIGEARLQVQGNELCLRHVHAPGPAYQAVQAAALRRTHETRRDGVPRSRRGYSPHPQTLLCRGKVPDDRRRGQDDHSRLYCRSVSGLIRVWTNGPTLAVGEEGGTGPGHGDSPQFPDD